MGNLYEFIIQFFITSGVVLLVFNRIFEKKMKKIEAKLEPIKKLAIDINNIRIEKYPKLTKMINTTRGFCKTIVIESRNYDFNKFNLMIKELQELYNESSTYLEIDKVNEQVYNYTVGFEDVFKNLIYYNSKIEEGNIESANETKGVIENSITKIRADGKLINTSLSEILKKNSLIN